PVRSTLRAQRVVTRRHHTPAVRSEVELAVLGAADEGFPFRGREEQRGPGRVLRVTCGPYTRQIVGHFDAVAGGPGSRALTPYRARQVHAPHPLSMSPVSLSPVSIWPGQPRS